MSISFTKRQGLALLASMLAIATNTPVSYAKQPFAGSVQGTPAQKKAPRPATDKITLTCLPGDPDFDPVKCHKEITD